MDFSDLDRYAYTLPPELIRRQPLRPRDSARLMIYDTRTDEVRFDAFRNIARFLPKTLVVLNDTRVLPARLWLRKPSGGRVEVLVLANEMESAEQIPFITDRAVRPGQKLFFPDGSTLLVESQEENVFQGRLESRRSFRTLLGAYGTTPIPHYLEGDGQPDERQLRRRYQSVFAAAGASIAAPTASLHFTPRVLHSLAVRGTETARVRLDVGLGTFAPLGPENFRTRKLHAEFVAVNPASARAVNQAKAAGLPIVAVGTTVMRTLEGIAREGKLRRYRGPLDTFIFPPHHFQIVNSLITNFHLPRSSLMLLVDAFLEYKQSHRRIQSLYAEALAHKLAFYSFGDSLLIL